MSPKIKKCPINNLSPLQKRLKRSRYFQNESTNTPKITRYFSSPKQKSSEYAKEEMPQTTKKGFQSSKNKGSESSKNKENSVKDKENCKENISGKSTFKKYGVHVPSYEDILRERKEYENYKAEIDNLVELVTDLPEIQTLGSDTEAEQLTLYISCSPKQQSSKLPEEKMPQTTILKKGFQSSNNKKSVMDKKNCKEKNYRKTTFKKYGVHVPSYEDILRERKEYENYKVEIDNLLELVTDLPEIETLDCDTEDEQLTLDCKDMSDDEVRFAFENNMSYLDNIYYENIYCKRHAMYKVENKRRELVYNTSTILFKNEHKQLLITLISEIYGKATRLSDYYFKVLLPELCLKIFMDKFSMNYKEASEYLDERPVYM